MNREIEHVLAESFTVRQLIETLQGMDPDARVLITSDYGDYHNTQQALPVRDIEEHESDTLRESSYSKSGIAFTDHNATPDTDQMPQNDDGETETVVILSTE